jgi:uncharacterized membrane protein
MVGGATNRSRWFAAQAAGYAGTVATARTDSPLRGVLRGGAAGGDARRLTRRFTVAGLLLGIGFGGFADGIVLHQILQWHHLLTSTGDHPATTVAGLETNTLWDGLFHAFTWLAALTGLFLLWSAMREGLRASARRLVGLILAGWGAFNLVEGIVDHHILTIHHVKAGENQLAFDLGFLALGAALLVAGILMARRAGPAIDRRTA